MKIGNTRLWKRNLRFIMAEMRMLPSSWKTSLNRLLNQQTSKSRIAVIGIGNTFRCDDAAGTLVARALMDSQLQGDPEMILVVDAGQAPENSAGELCRFHPNIILMVDAAEMGQPPGAIDWIEMDELEGMTASTHSLPLSMLAKYLALELNCSIGVLGIQPRSNDVGETVSAEVTEAVNQVVEELIASLF